MKNIGTNVQVIDKLLNILFPKYAVYKKNGRRNYYYTADYSIKTGYDYYAEKGWSYNIDHAFKYTKCEAKRSIKSMNGGGMIKYYIEVI